MSLSLLKTIFLHTHNFVAHNFVTPNFVSQLSFGHSFVTHTHTHTHTTFHTLSLSHTLFVTHTFFLTQLCHTHNFVTHNSSDTTFRIIDPPPSPLSFRLSPCRFKLCSSCLKRLTCRAIQSFHYTVDCTLHTSHFALDTLHPQFTLTLCTLLYT